MHDCNDCGELLVSGQNWYRSFESNYVYICIICARKRDSDKRRKKGIGQRGKKYGVSRVLPNGMPNPEYERRRGEARRRAKGIKPRPENWGNTYGVPWRLDDGKQNPEFRKRYDEKRLRAKGVKEFVPAEKGKYGVPKTLPDGSRNPKYRNFEYKNGPNSKDRTPHPPNWGTLGVPSILPNGKSNPEYGKLYRSSSNGKAAKAKGYHKRNRNLPTKIILGSWFPRAHLHHMTPDVAVYIPKALHESIRHNIWTGKNMDKINTLAMEFYERGH